jgi:hypothetical protein
VHTSQIELRNVIALRNPRTVCAPWGNGRLATARYFFLFYSAICSHGMETLLSSFDRISKRAKNSLQIALVQSCTRRVRRLHQVMGCVCERNETNKKQVHGLKSGATVRAVPDPYGIERGSARGVLLTRISESRFASVGMAKAAIRVLQNDTATGRTGHADVAM